MPTRPALAALFILVAGGAAHAGEPLRCTGFLHNRDGSWRSFNQADVLGPNGVVHLNEGDRLWPSDKSGKGDLARALNELCGS